MAVSPYYRPASRLHLVAEGLVGLFPGALGLVLIAAAITNHAWIDGSVALPVSWLAVATVLRRPALAIGYLVGFCIALAAAAVFVVCFVSSGGLHIGSY